jgi:F0F1-type ATP synthase membrane subunit b/b'
MSMRFWTAYAFLAFGFTKAYGAAGAAGDGSWTDLIAPAVNLGILLGVLIWKLKGPLHNHFVSKSNDVANTLERANLKTKEAKMMLDNEDKKIANLSSDLKSITQQAENDVNFFEKKLSQETEEKTHKLKSDANMKIQADKKALMDDLNAELLNQVIAKTKTTIKTNKEYQNKVSTKLLQGL